MGPWPSKVIPLNTGVDGSDNPAAPKEKIVLANNVDFTLKGGVRGRPGLIHYSVVDGASVINQKVTDGTGSYAYAYTNAVHGDPLSTWVKDMGECAPIAVRSHGQEYPGFVYGGRTYVYDGVDYRDKQGGIPLKVTRQTPLTLNVNPGLQDAGADPNSDQFSVFVASHFFAYDNMVGINPIDPPTSATKWTVHLADRDGATGQSQASDYAPGPGSQAVLGGNAWGAVHTSANNQLILTTSTAGSTIIQYLLDGSVNRSVRVGTGCSPCICADQDSSVFYIAYLDFTGLITVIRVTYGGTITHSITLPAPGGEGEEINGLWISNSTVAIDRVVIAYTQTMTAGIKTTVRHMTDLTTWLNDLTVGTTYGPGAGPVVVGAVDSGGCWLSYRIGTGIGAGSVITFKRNWTIQSWTVWELSGKLRSESTPKFGKPAWYIQHQPVVFQNRVLMTVTLEPGYMDNDMVGANKLPRRTYGQMGCTWMTVDLTDMAFAPRAASASGTMSDWSHQFPAVVARGPTEETCQPWNPFSAVVQTVYGSYFEFASVDWTQFAEYKASGTGGASTPAFILGFDGTIAMNKVERLAPSYAYANDSTVIAGSVPYIISRGNAEEAGWAENRPIAYTTVAAGASTIKAGDYSVCVVWKYTDDAGQIYRSEPSPITTVNVPTDDIKTFSVDYTLPVITRKNWMRIRADIYVTDKNPTVNAAFYYQKTEYVGEFTPYWTTIIDKVITDSPELYTDGNIFANQFVRADGGVVTVGQRCWVADDYRVHASKLPSLGDVPGWYVDGALSLSLPSTAGRIVGLSRIQEKLVIFAERGVFISAGDGPDNANNGTDFVTPEQVSELGLAEMRGCVATPQGVFFISSNLTTSASSYEPTGQGGIYLLNPGCTVSWVNQRLLGMFGTTAAPVELVYSPERDWLIIMMVNANDTLAIVHDLRANQYSLWSSAIPVFDSSGRNLRGCSVQGAPLIVGDVPYFTRETRKDRDSSVTYDYTMSLDVREIRAGDDNLVWGRFRGVKVLGYSSTTYSLTLTGELDNRLIGADTKTVVPGAVLTTWPSRWELTEWRLPTQKGSVLSITLSSSSGEAVWSGLEVAFKPANRAIAGSRS